MIRKPMQKDSGQVLVIVTLLLVVLLGISAAAIDSGMDMITVNHLQNVSNASALAGATEIALAQSKGATEANAEAAAKTTIQGVLDANAIPSSYLVATETNPDPNITSTLVQVSLTAPHFSFLGRVLGLSGAFMTQSAKALVPSSSGSGGSGGGVSPFNYAIFSDQPLTLTSAAYITGGVHCNSTVSLNFSGSSGSYITGGIEDIGGAYWNGNALGGNPVYPSWMNTSNSGAIYAANTGTFNNNAPFIPIAGTPDPTTLADALNKQADAKTPQTHVITKDNWKSTLHPNYLDSPYIGYQWTFDGSTFIVSGSYPKLQNGPWYFEGNLQNTCGGTFTVDGAVVATGQIQLGGTQLLSTGSSGFAFYSLSVGSEQNPSISTSMSNGPTSKATGTFYAPYGNISLTGGNPIITGSVIGKKVTATNGLTVTYDPNNVSNQLLTGTGASSRANLTK